MRRFAFVRSWRTTSQQDLESRICDVVGSLDAAVEVRPRIIEAQPGASTPVQVGDLVLCPSSCAVVLPIPQLQCAGRKVTVIAQSGSTIVRPTTGTVSGASSVTLTTPTPRDFYCTGTTWV